MKKITLVVLLIMGALFANAQTALLPATDTLTNAETVDLSLKIPGSNNVLTFQLNAVKISGTTAGSAFLQASLDGTNYLTVPGTDTLTLANSNNYKFWVLDRSNFLYYRIRVVGTGTQSTQLKGIALYRP